MAEFKYASINQAPLYESVVNGKGKKIINKILMGTYVTILEKNGDWYRVATGGGPTAGFMPETLAMRWD